MKTGEIVELLVSTKSYATTRVFIPNDVINLIKDHMPSHYALFQKKEELYQEMLKESGNPKAFTKFLKELAKTK